MVVPTEAQVCGRSLAGIAGSILAGGRGCSSFVSVVCFQVEVSYRVCVCVCVIEYDHMQQ